MVTITATVCMALAWGGGGAYYPLPGPSHSQYSEPLGVPVRLAGHKGAAVLQQASTCACTLPTDPCHVRQQDVCSLWKKMQE